MQILLQSNKLVPYAHSVEIISMVFHRIKYINYFESLTLFFLIVTLYFTVYVAEMHTHTNSGCFFKENPFFCEIIIINFQNCLNFTLLAFNKGDLIGRLSI